MNKSLCMIVYYMVAIAKSYILKYFYFYRHIF